MSWTPDSVLLVGGPDAGKSNYLSRAWLAMESGDSKVVADRLPDDAAYIQEGADRLLQGKFVPRTEGVTYQPTRIPVQVGSAAAEVGTDLVIPDCSGELWWDVYDKRRWRQAWEEHVSAPVGLLVFYRVDSAFNVPPLDWLSCQQLLGCDPTQAPTNLTAPTPGYQSSKNGLDAAQQGVGARETPTQVVLVDLIQLLVRAARRNGNSRIRLALAVTAWDRVPPETEDGSPRAYVERELPLLSQFLDAALDIEAVEVFGVSITGGDLAHDAEFRAEYLEAPHEHGYVVSGESNSVERSPDLTLPIAWLTGAHEAR